MTFKEKIVSLITTDTDIFVCPIGTSGSAHGLVFANLSASNVSVTLKLYSTETGTTTIISQNRIVLPNSEFTWPKPININAGDKIIASASTSNIVTAVVSLYLSGLSGTSSTLNIRGTYSSVATYSINDVVTYLGSSYAAVVSNTNSTPPSSNWMLLASKGDAGPAGADSGSPSYAAKIMFSEIVTYSTIIPLSQLGVKYMPQYTISGATTFTTSTTKVAGAFCTFELIPDGINIPVFSGMEEDGGSQSFLNVSGIPNQITVEYNGNRTLWSARQAVGATAVVTVPGQVTGLTVGTPTNLTVPLAWSLPSGSAPTDYIVEYKLTSSGVWLNFADGTSTVRSTTVTGLTASSAYDFRVSATNSAGTGAVSTTVSATTMAAAPVATTVTMTGPTTGTVSVASTNFTVSISPTGGTVSGTLVVTPSDSAAGGTFTPANINLTTGTPSGTFKYTPSATAGSRTISVTNNGGLTNSTSITYTSTAAATATAPFTATARGAFPLTMASGTTNYMWHDVTTNAAPTITTITSAISTSNTIAPTSSIGELTTPKGHWLGALTNYSGGTSYIVDGPAIANFNGAATNYYFWIQIVDSNAATWNFCHTAPINIGDGVSLTTTSGTTPTPQV